MKFALINRSSIPESFRQAFVKFFGADLLTRQEVKQNKSLLKNYDFVMIYGVIMRQYKEWCKELGVNWVFLDKGVDREILPNDPNRMVRFSVNSYYPHKHYHKFENNSSRVNTVADFLPIRKTQTVEPDSPVVFAGSSHKYHAFHELIPDPTQYAKKQIEKIRLACDRPIIYKPKPSWKDKSPIEGTFYITGGGLEKWISKGLIKKPHCVISHGSGILMEANFLGIPTICLGASPVCKISRTTIEHIDNLYVPTLDEKYKIANAVSSFQWNSSEIESGEMWNYLKPVFEEELNGS